MKEQVSSGDQRETITSVNSPCTKSIGAIDLISSARNTPMQTARFVDIADRSAN